MEIFSFVLFMVMLGAFAFLYVDLTGGKKLTPRAFKTYLSIIAVSGGISLIGFFAGF